ncbi:cellular communication network factor 1, like 1 [Brachyhypopomus gauderio]|uniref:cellular communication network factor 1, like 1 n=1 Tax=Brachyhypopomus gauderio TaxID=698409 RepID=UPI00404355FD
MCAFRMIVKQVYLLTLMFLPWSALKVQSACPLKCSCPVSPPSCPPGISSVLDSCGCCRVCARQFNQDCSAAEPCDHIKGLRCHLGAGGDPDRGLCRAEAHGRPCELDGRVYQHGEDFQPGCEHRCSCVDGVVGCVPVCPHRVPLPEWRCSRPRLVTPPARCCQEWVCDDDNRIAEDDLTRELAPHEHTDLGGNELLASTPWDSSAAAPYQEWMSVSQSHALITSGCFMQTTDWSSCSATCGMGVSSRVTNKNAECRLVRETRLCQIRECGGSMAPSSKKGKKCQKSIRPPTSAPVVFAGCSTTRRYRQRSCGSCVDGRCCVPSLTRTIRMRFRCPRGDGFTRSVMWIEQCSCGQKCGGEGRERLSEPFSLPNDIHTFTH